MAYLAGLIVGGVTDVNSSALFVFDPTLGDLLIVRNGDLFDVGGGDFRTIASIGFRAGRSDDALAGLSNDGTLAFSLNFTDFTSGVFTAVVPEPGSLALSAVGSAGLLRRRRVYRAAVVR